MSSNGYFIHQQYRQFGELYGYPNCCIDSYIPFFMRPPHYTLRYKQSVFHQSGYLPCDVCLGRDPQDLINEINARRNSILPPFTTEGR